MDLLQHEQQWHMEWTEFSLRLDCISACEGWSIIDWCCTTIAAKVERTSWPIVPAERMKEVYGHHERHFDAVQHGERFDMGRHGMVSVEDRNICLTALCWEDDRTMGQLFMMGFDGTEVTPQIRQLIEKHHLGTILLTAKNLKCK